MAGSLFFEKVYELLHFLFCDLLFVEVEGVFHDMKHIIACCGLTCSLCGAYLATQSNNDEERKKVAEKWSKVLNVEMKPEQINCDGCLSEGRLFFYC